MPEQNENAFVLLWKRMAGQPQKELLAQYVAGPDDLEAALAGLNESDLDVTREPGKWTIRQIVHHIVDGDDIWKACLKVALGNPGSTFDFGWYDQESWVEWMDYADRNIAPSLALFRANRSHIVQLVRHLPDAWERQVLITWPHIPEGRTLTVGNIICTQTIHVPWHIDQIRATQQVLGR